MPGEPVPRCDFDSDKLILNVDVTIAADLGAISAVVDKLMGTVREMGCAAGEEFAVETALREALANAVVHGCEKDPNKKVQLSVACDEARGMIIVVRDPGSGFDPKEIPSPIMGQNVYSHHGRGIYLINQLMDEVRFEKGGTEIHMRKG